MGREARVAINREPDIVVARQQGRDLAVALGFTSGDLALIATAISEITRNVIQYATAGEMTARIVGDDKARRGVEIVVEDRGPGIPNLQQAMQDGYSTGGGLGLGLPGARRLMDEFEITTKVGHGTRIVMRKWTR
jgi:serine/threonine-protein kinase RsbT